MKRYVTVQHSYSEFLGLIETQLERREIGFNYYRPFTGQHLPTSALHFDGLFLLGGAVPTLEEESCPWIDEERALTENFIEKGRPVVGIGFGAMVIAEHFGATAYEEPFNTAYWTTAKATEAGKDDKMAQAVDGKRVLVMYNGFAKLPEGMEPTVVDEEGNWLAIRPAENVMAMLFRPELKPGMIEDMIMEDERETPDDIGEILETARMEWGDTQKMTDQFVVGMVTELDLMQERHKTPVFSLKVESSDAND